VAITSAQVFVRSDRSDRLVKVLESYLSRWAKSVRESWPDCPFLGRDAARTLRVLPAAEGWCCMVDADPYRADFQLARELSAELRTQAVALELRGGELVWSCAAFDGGAAVREQREPPEAFGPDRGSGEIQMPIYPDATREALAALRSEGLPQAFWLLRADELVEDASAGDLDVAEIVVRPEKKDAVEPVQIVPCRLRREAGVLPFRPDLEGTTSDHRPLFVEIRTLFGRATHQAVDNLLEIERADRNRLLAPFIEREDDDCPEVQFEYTSRGTPEEELKRMLDRRRPEFFRSRPTEREFLAMALETVRARHTGWRGVRPDGFGIRFERSGATNRIDLAQTYSDYIEGRAAAPTPEDTIRSFLARAAEDLERAPDRTEFAAVSDLLLPCLVGADEAARLEADGVASGPLGHGVKVVVACQVGGGTALLDSGDLALWGVKFSEALACARANLERRMKGASRGFVPVEYAPGRKALACLVGGQPATQLLLPGLVSLARELVHSDDILCAIPDQDSFLMIPAGDPEAAEKLREFARSRLLLAERPLTAELFRVNEQGISEA